MCVGAEPNKTHCEEENGRNDKILEEDKNWNEWKLYKLQL